MKKHINIRFIVLVLIILLIGIWRVLNNGGQLTPLSNFSPIGALALFGGTYFLQKIRAYLFPLLMLFISDIVMMHTYFSDYQSGLLYDGWYWNYAAFGLMVFFGTLINQPSPKNIFLASVGAALAHYLISDFGVWLSGGIDLSNNQPFTRDWHGLMRCYILAIPFLKNMLISTILYSTVLFGAFELASHRFPILAKPAIL